MHGFLLHMLQDWFIFTRPHSLLLHMLLIMTNAASLIFLFILVGKSNVLSTLQDGVTNSQRAD
jgi:hypothetical protein